MRRLEQAAAYHEEAAESGEKALLGLAYGELLMARGEFAAIKQHTDLEDMLATSDVDRPAHMPPRLMLVRR